MLSQQKGFSHILKHLIHDGDFNLKKTQVCYWKICYLNLIFRIPIKLHPGPQGTFSISSSVKISIPVSFPKVVQNCQSFVKFCRQFGKIFEEISYYIRRSIELLRKCSIIFLKNR